MSRVSQWCIAVQTLLSGRHHRKSIDGMRAVDGRGSIDEQPVTGDGSCLTKLTLMDLITDHSIKSGALPPGAHMTRRSMQLEPPKKIQARRSDSGDAACVICLSCPSAWVHSVSCRTARPSLGCLGSLLDLSCYIHGVWPFACLHTSMMPRFLVWDES